MNDYPWAKDRKLNIMTSQGIIVKEQYVGHNKDAMPQRPAEDLIAEIESSPFNKDLPVNPTKEVEISEWERVCEMRRSNHPLVKGGNYKELIFYMEKFPKFKAHIFSEFFMKWKPLIDNQMIEAN